MNGFRNLSLSIVVFGLIGAIVYEYGKRRETVEYLFVRWETYQAFCLKVALIAFVAVTVSSLIIWITDTARRRRQRQNVRLVDRTKRQVIADRDESDRIRERNMRQISERWSRELEAK